MARHRRAWRALCEALEGIELDHEKQRVVISVAARAASMIDPEVRVSKRSWWERSANGDHEPRHELATELRAHGCHWTTDSLTNLVQDPHLRNLEVLRLEDAALSDRAIDILLNAPWLENLRELYLGRNLIGDIGLERLAKSHALPRLEILSLAGNQLNDAGILAMLEGHTLRSLRALYLDDNALGDASVEALAISPMGRRLEQLGLSGNEHITSKSIEVLRQRLEVGFPALEQVHLLSCGDGASDASALCLMRDVRRLAKERAIS